tara:strand:- start:663 stop:1172 length:510 start_codon:yes stop_codon:yes gene_type:complete
VKKNLILLGMMGVGKSTLGKIVAKKLKLKFIDTDLSIEKKISMKIAEIFKNKGESFFRDLEEREVLESLKRNNHIIALGGGAFMNKNIRDTILQNAISIWLDIDLKAINRRIKWNKKRPLVDTKNTREIIKKLYIKRKNIYKMADHKIKCDNLSKENIANKIIDFYEKY